MTQRRGRGSDVASGRREWVGAGGAPTLRSIRESWLASALDELRADTAVLAAGLVGSLGRGEADDWSDVDLLIVVGDGEVDRYGNAARLPGAKWASLSFDAPHNAPRGARAVSVQYVLEGLPLWVDWYVFSQTRCAWASDAEIAFDRLGFARTKETFAEQLARGEARPGSPKDPEQHRLLQVALLPVAAKRIARRSPDAPELIAFVGGPDVADASPLEQLRALRSLLAEHGGGAPDALVLAIGRYLDLVEEGLSSGDVDRR